MSRSTAGHRSFSIGYLQWVPAFDFSAARLAPIAGGGGWAWRAAHAAGYVSGTGEWGVVGLLAECDGAGSPEEVIGRVVLALSGEGVKDGPWPPFSLVTSAPGGGLAVLVHGPTEVTVEREGGSPVTVKAEGRWSLRVVKGAHRVRLGGRDHNAGGLADLRAGVLPAAGAILVRSDDDREPKDKGEPPPALAAAERYPAHVLPADEIATTMAPAAGATVASPPDTDEDVEGERPPVIAITWDRGDTDLIHRNTVVGRDPVGDPAVSGGEADALVPRGKSEGMSRIHADMKVIGWEVLLSDRGSTNGTFVWDDEHQAWQRLEPGERFPLRVGSIIAFGERTATVEPPPSG